MGRSRKLEKECEKLIANLADRINDIILFCIEHPDVMTFAELDQFMKEAREAVKLNQLDKPNNKTEFYQ